MFHAVYIVDSVNLTRRRPSRSYRNRRMRIEQQNQEWRARHTAMLANILEFEYKGTPMVVEDGVCHPSITVMDTFGKLFFRSFIPVLTGNIERREIRIGYVENEDFTSTLARYGYIATAPVHPNLAISLATLDLFRAVRSRCPSLSIQAFVRALDDMHKVS